jgi:hypothetical protein
MHLNKLGFKDLTKLAKGLIKDIKDCHIHLWSSFNSDIEKSNDSCMGSPVIVAFTFAG